MILCLANVLSADEVQRVLQRLKPARFASGRRTAGWHAKLVKNNRQLASPQAAADAAALVSEALEGNELFQSAVRPLRLSPILFNKYAPGMAYGAHVDDPVMQSRDGGRLRSDVSVTVFLSDPKTYKGGELVIEDTGGERVFRPNAGDAILYPATTLHRVEPVRRGVRLAAVAWIQSLVADAGRREILFDLDTARRALFAAHGKTREFDLITKSHANLVRLWSSV